MAAGVLTTRLVSCFPYLVISQNLGPSIDQISQAGAVGAVGWRSAIVSVGFKDNAGQQQLTGQKLLRFVSFKPKEQRLWQVLLEAGWAGRSYSGAL